MRTKRVTSASEKLRSFYSRVPRVYLLRGQCRPPKQKSEKEIQSEIQAIIRQITASVTFLPLLDERCSFDLLVYTDAEAEVPRTWEESDPRYIANSNEVRLRSFTTKVHKVDTMVSFRGDDDDV